MAGCLFTQEGFLDIGKKTLKSNESYEGGSIHRLEEKCGSSHLGVMIQRALLKKESKSDNVQGNWYSTKIKGICLSFGTFFLALLYAWIDNDVGYCQGIRRSDWEFRLQVSVIYVAAHTSASIARDRGSNAQLEGKVFIFISLGVGLKNFHKCGELPHNQQILITRLVLSAPMSPIPPDSRSNLVSVKKWQAAFYAQKGFLGIGKSPSRMNPTRGNLRSTGRSVGAEAQLTHLATITQIIDPKVHYLLETSYLGPHAKIGFSEQMTWALLEYEPDMYSLYEEPHFEGKKMEGSSKGEEIGLEKIQE
ncbi:hypothetical protein F2Q70_00005004 [Brassica cretica]|uniref:Uncharacterized protein n=1 Tax=Brassica cretica TaxID=69181 RepID=A0A8S9ITU4_BRACR|nr:hypothetical protein F2Q70_00005004 [Brassica cretica]